MRNSSIWSKMEDADTCLLEVVHFIKQRYEQHKEKALEKAGGNVAAAQALPEIARDEGDLWGEFGWDQSCDVNEDHERSTWDVYVSKDQMPMASREKIWSIGSDSKW